jgi:selenide,water dikinase
VPFADPAVLVDASTGDDAAVYRLDADRALVATTDFFSPVVDDPFDFGRIAAANALSDIYAMGARPLFALNLIAFPRALLGSGALAEIVRGGGEVAAEAGIAVVGGHSIDDPEPKYGMCVVGEVRLDALVRNSGARPGDLLVLTKPLGTGVITTALKAGAAPAPVVTAAVSSMATLNRSAAEAMAESGANAATDVTGFGLLGHLAALLGASGAAARIHASGIPLLPGARELADLGYLSGGTLRNREDLSPVVDWEPDVPMVLRLLLCDAQTSGGLLIAIPGDRAIQLLESLRARRTPAATIIGEVVAGESGRIQVVV